MKHEIDHGDVDHGLCGVKQVLVVLGQAPVFVKPCEGALDDPALADHLEAFGLVAAFDDVQQPVAEVGNLLHELSAVAAVGVNAPEFGPFAALLAQHKEAPVAVLDRGGHHSRRQDEAEGVDEQVPLDALDFLAGVVAAESPFFCVDLTDCESMMAAEGHGLRPWDLRTSARKASWMAFQVPSLVQRLK